MACSDAGKRRNERKNGLRGLERLGKTAQTSALKVCVLAFTIDTQRQGVVAPDPGRTEDGAGASKNPAQAMSAGRARAGTRCRA